MNRGDDVPPDDVDFLDLGPKRRPDAVRRRARLLYLVAAGAVAAAVVATVRSGGTPSGSPTTSPPAATGSRLSTPAPSTASVTTLGHRLLAVRAGWELFVRGDEVVVRIQFARGRITRTAYPALASSGPVSFVTDADGAFVRPIDNVPGYLIPDGRPARPAPGALDISGPAFPGPDPRHLWVPASRTGSGRMVLVGMDGRRTATSLVAPPPSAPPVVAIPDQTGYLLFPGRGGIYDVRPGRTSRVTNARLLAVGPTRWLTATCDKQTARCNRVVVDRATGAHRALQPRLNLRQVTQPGPGVISPDGTVAAVPVGEPSTRMELINLTTGAAHVLPLVIDPAIGAPLAEAMVWSPDSRWLFIDADGDLDAVNPRTGQVTNLSQTLGAALPQLFQLSMRNAHPS